MNAGYERSTHGAGHRGQHRGPDSAAPAESAGDESPEAHVGADTNQAPPDAGDVADNPQQRARDAVYQLLAVRARSYAELHTALLRKSIAADVAEEVLGRFVDAGLIDDAAFAEEWVRSRHRGQGLGRRALAYELRRKGVADELVRAALETVDESAEETQARELVRRKLRTTRGDSTTRMRRLLGLLGRKGYAEGLAFRVVREELEQSGVDTAEIDADEAGDGRFSGQS